jgi:hypothetical protein
MRLDVLATREHYWHHLGPVWEALPEELRGTRHYALSPAVRPENRPQRAVLLCSAHDLTQAVRAGYERVAYLEHGIGQPYSGAAGYPGGAGRDRVGLFLSPNATSAAADAARYPEAHVAVVGDPALEHLPHREAGQRPVVAVSFHWDALGAPEMRSAYTHYRTALPALAERYTLIGHGHPRAWARLERVWRKLGVEPVARFEEVCRRAALYVADNTSTLYEFASTGRPVVVLNAPWYRRSVEHGLRFWQASGVGVHANEPGQLLGAVAVAMDDPGWQRELRERALRLVYANRRGAAELAAQALEEWLA